MTLKVDGDFSESTGDQKYSNQIEADSNINPHRRCSILEIENLKVWFSTPAGKVHAVNGVDLQLQAGQRLAIIGESGCGKSVLAQALFRLLPSNAKSTGRVLLSGQDLFKKTPCEIREIRGAKIGLIPQHLSSLNPLLRIGTQLSEAIAPQLSRWKHYSLRNDIVDRLEKVALQSSATSRFPHELSGGMNRRVLISIGSAQNPNFLVADEPTTGLDYILRRRIIGLIDECTIGKTLLMITHDIEVAQFCDTIAVMYAGKIIEQGPTKEILRNPQHPYTKGLLGSMPSKGMRPIKGDSPSLINLPSGCAFHPRCAYAHEMCQKEGPTLCGDVVKIRCNLNQGSNYAHS